MASPREAHTVGLVDTAQEGVIRFAPLAEGQTVGVEGEAPIPPEQLEAELLRYGFEPQGSYVRHRNDRISSLDKDGRTGLSVSDPVESGRLFGKMVAVIEGFDQKEVDLVGGGKGSRFRADQTRFTVYAEPAFKQPLKR